MITRAEASAIAAEHVKRLSDPAGIELVLVHEQTLEEDFGWVFTYNSKAYLSSGKLSDMLAGNAPFIVDKRNGAIHETGTAEPIQIYLERYRQFGSPYSQDAGKAG